MGRHRRAAGIGPSHLNASDAGGGQGVHCDVGRAGVNALVLNSPPVLYINPHHGTPGLVVLPAGGWHRAQRALAAWPDQGAITLQTVPGGYVAEDGALWGGGIHAVGGAYGAQHAALAVLSRAGAVADAAGLWAGAWGGRPDLMLASLPSETGVRRAAEAFGCGWTGAPQGSVGQDAAGQDAVGQNTVGQNGAEWVSPVATPGYTEMPREIMQAYRWLAESAMQQWAGSPPTHVIVPGGDGALAAACSVHLRAWGARLVVVEPAGAAPLLAQAQGVAQPGVSLLAWQELERAAYAFVAGPLAPHAETLGLDGRSLVITQKAAETALGR